MASRFGQRRHPQDRAGSSVPKDRSPTSPLCTSAIWWNDSVEERDRGGSLREQLQTMDDHVASLQDMLKYERAKCSRLHMRCHQQEAELRRREQNINRMKERLSMFTDKHKDKTPTIKILNTVTSARGKREQPSAKRQEEDAVRLMLERREAELREAMKLRHSLTSLLHALRCDMEQTLSELEGCKDETRCVDKRLDQAERALGDHVTGGVVQSWRQIQKKLQAFTCEGTTEFGTDHDKLMAQLKSELKQSQQLVQIQQQLLQDSIGSPVPPELGDCYFIEEWDRLRGHWAEFELQKRTFDRERQTFTDAAIRLNYEVKRAVLRRDFEQLKASLLKQQFLCESPALGKGIWSNTNRESTCHNFSGIKPMNTPKSPMAPSPAPVSRRGDVTGYPTTARVQTPSTPELYSALSLAFYPCRGTEDDRTNLGADTTPTLDLSF